VKLLAARHLYRMFAVDRRAPLHRPARTDSHRQNSLSVSVRNVGDAMAALWRIFALCTRSRGVPSTRTAGCFVPKDGDNMTVRQRLTAGCLLLFVLMFAVIALQTITAISHWRACAQVFTAPAGQHETAGLQQQMTPGPQPDADRFSQLAAHTVRSTRLTAILIALCAVAGVLSGYLCILSWDRLGRGMRGLQTGLQSLASGVWDTVIEYPWQDEFGQCAKHFNKMASQLRKHTELLARMASRDPLTDLLNRRMFMEHLTREVSIACQLNGKLSLIMIDLDHFKQVNDRYGHAFGDRALSHIGARLRALVRESDHVGRLGGEELAILLPAADLQEAIRVAEQLQSSLACEKLPCGSESVRLSASFGVAQLDVAGQEAPDDLLRRADRALYAAKGRGRDVVVAAGLDEPDDGPELPGHANRRNGNGERTPGALHFDSDSLGLIGSMFTLLHVMPDKHRVATDLIEQVAAILDCQRVTLLMLSPSSEELYVEAARGLPMEKSLVRIPMSGAPLEAILNPDEDEHAFNWRRMPPDVLVRGRRTDSHSINDVVYIALAVQGEPIGLVVATERRSSHPPTKRQLAVLRALAAIGSVALKNCMLSSDREDQWIGSIRALASAMDANDPYTCNHSTRVAWMAVRVGRTLGIRSETELRALHMAGLVHDIGKIGIPHPVLQKSTRLRRHEYRAIQEHCMIGARILENIPRLRSATEAVLHHHEWYDGSGYPNGITGEEIPLASRILAVADAFDAMTSERPYRGAMPTDVAIAEIKKSAGQQFDPMVVDAFIRSFDESLPSELELLLQADTAETDDTQATHTDTPEPVAAS